MKTLRKGRLFPRQLFRQFGNEGDLFGSDGRIGSFLHRFPFVIASVLAIVGVLCDSWWYESLQSSALRWGTVGVTAAILPSVHRHFFGIKSSATRDPAHYMVWASAAVLFVCVFGCWHAVCEQSYRRASILELVDQTSQPIIVRGTLDRAVTLRRNPLSFGPRRVSVSPWQSQLTVAIDRRRVQGDFLPIDGLVLVYVDGDLSDLRPGDALEIYGWLHSIDGPTNPGEPDLRPSYRRRGIHGRIETKSAGAVTVIKESGRPVRSLIASIATQGRRSLLRHTDDQTGALAVALVIGQREFVDPKTRDALLATGTAHLLSVSGMHLAILVLVATWGVSALGLQPTSRFLVIVAISALYVAVTGGRPPVMRAAILIAVLLLSTCFRRTSQPLNTLAVAAVTLIVINPMNVFAVGVHLSFLAVITLMLAGRPIAPGSMQRELELQRETGFESLIETSTGPWIRNTKTLLRFFGQMAWLSACVTGISLPLVWQQFHLVSVVSVFTNVAVWAGLMIALPMGVLTVILDPIHYWLGAVPGTMCHWALRYMWTVIDWTQRVPGGHFWLPSPSTASVICFYLVMVVSLLWRTRRAVWFRCGWVLVWTASTFLMVTRPGPLPPDTLEATFVDVGHGTSVIVRTDDGKVWLYDCGRMGNSQGTSRDIDTALWSLGVTHLDGIFLSHADADHYNALPAILDRFGVDVLITPPGMLDQDEDALAEIRLAIAVHSTNVREIAAGGLSDVIDNPAMSVLHPPLGGVPGSDNANSLVLRIDHFGSAFLLPGDLEPPGTESLVSAPRPPAGGVLMAPHHGSLTMNADAVLAWARPRETIVSGSRRAARVEVEAMLSATGSGVHVTARDGAVRVRLDELGRIQVRTWREEPW
ncbi:MAG: ComEC/Rec2 family competence protein [Planctomycetales bacterium]|nr:ComEC/Rec2 family competence protein [Planctomycetales bacterium]